MNAQPNTIQRLTSWIFAFWLLSFSSSLLANPQEIRVGIADSVLAEVEQPFFVAPEHLDYLFDRLQLAAHRVVRPGFEEALGSTLVAVVPELASDR